MRRLKIQRQSEKNIFNHQNLNPCRKQENKNKLLELCKVVSFSYIKLIDSRNSEISVHSWYLTIHSTLRILSLFYSAHLRFQFLSITKSNLCGQKFPKDKLYPLTGAFFKVDELSRTSVIMKILECFQARAKFQFILGYLQPPTEPSLAHFCV